MAEIKINSSAAAQGDSATTEDENTVAEDEKQDDGVFTRRLIKTLTYEGESYKTLTFDFSTLTGRDCINISTELAAVKKNALIPSLSADYRIRFAARACAENLPFDALLLLSAGDYLAIDSAVRSFLLAQG